MRKKVEKTSIIWTISIENLKNIIDSNDALYKVLECLGLSGKSAGSYRELQKRIKQDNIDISKLEEKRKIKQMQGVKQFQNTNRKTNEEIFIKSNNSEMVHLVKRRILEEKLFEYKCKECGLTSIWNNKPISLQLEHINGDHQDNRLENLCFLCPNCHSQTKTFGSKNKKQPKNKCKHCGKEIIKKSTYCSACVGTNNHKFEIPKEEMEKLIQEKSFVEIGKLFGVTDNSIKKRCIKLGIDLSKRLNKRNVHGS